MDEPLFATLVASDNRPQSKRMRDLIPQIERVFAMGYSHKQIHSELVKNGLMISFLNYKKVLARERKKLATCEDGRRTVGHERSANEAKPRVPVASVSPAARPWNCNRACGCHGHTSKCRDLSQLAASHTSSTLRCRSSSWSIRTLVLRVHPCRQLLLCAAYQPLSEHYSSLFVNQYVVNAQNIFGTWR
jgi:hypothetical protein